MNTARDWKILMVALAFLAGACSSSTDESPGSSAAPVSSLASDSTEPDTTVAPVESSTPDTLPGGTSVVWRAGRDEVPDLTETLAIVNEPELILLAPDDAPEGFRSVDINVTTAPVEDGTSIVRITVDFRNGDEKGKIKIAPRVTGNERERCAGLVATLSLDGTPTWTPQPIRGANGCVWDREEDGLRTLNMQWEDGTVLYRATTTGPSSDIVLAWLDEWVPVNAEA